MHADDPKLCVWYVLFDFRPDFIYQILDSLNILQPGKISDVKNPGRIYILLLFGQKVICINPVWYDIDGKPRAKFFHLASIRIRHGNNFFCVFPIICFPEFQLHDIYFKKGCQNFRRLFFDIMFINQVFHGLFNKKNWNFGFWNMGHDVKCLRVDQVVIARQKLVFYGFVFLGGKVPDYQKGVSAKAGS